MINKLKEYNQRYMQNISHGDEAAEEIFELTDRRTALILSAPHSTRSFVCKKEKPADLYTGALVQYVGEVCSVSTLIRTKFTPYKVLISDYIEEKGVQNHYFLDIHGFNQDMDADICLGTGSWEAKEYPYLDKILKIAEKYTLKAAVNHPDYRGICGLTGRYQKTFNKPNVIQMELQQRLRNFYTNPEIVENITVPFLADVIKAYN